MKEQVKLSATDKLLVGASAGAISSTLVFPIDTIKTRLQAQAHSGGPVQMFKNILSKEGPVGFYRGLPLALAGIIPEKGVQLGVNEICRDAFAAPDGSVAFHHQLLSGMAAGACQSLVNTPGELLKIRFQTQALLVSLAAAAAAPHPAPAPPPPPSALGLARALGPGGLYAGFWPCLARDVTFGLVCFPLFAGLRALAAGEQGELSNASLICLGTIAGGVASGVCTPPDVVKTRMQVRSDSSSKGYSLRESIKVLSRIVQEEGVVTLFRGVSQRIPQTGLKTALVLFCFEKQKQYLQQQDSSPSRYN